jgi:choline dehydrogenase-like flavoprotein
MNPDDAVIRESREEFDAIVIGSGITGGWAAKEFTERGLKTLMLERGGMVTHQKDYVGEGVPPWQQKNRGRVDKALLESDYPVQSRCYAFKESSRAFFGNDRELPFQTKEGTEFSWIRGNSLGGKSLLWARQCYRWSDFDFEANKNDGIAIDWPLRYGDLERWYSHVETHAGISGHADGLEQIPDSQCLPPFEMTSPELAFKKVVEREFPGRSVVIGRTANLSTPGAEQQAQGRAKCQARDQCENGCSFGAYFSTQSSTLPAALKTGHLRIAPNSVVHSLIYDAERERVRGVRVIDAEDLSEREYFGKVVFLCASTLGSTQILMNSKTAEFPNGLANRSGVLGHYLMDHSYNASVTARVPGFEDEYYMGRRPTGIYVPNFHYKPQRYAKDYIRGYALGGKAYRQNWKSFRTADGFGEAFKNKVTRAGQWRFLLYAQGEMLPRYENEVALHPVLKDKWGIPQLEFNCRWSENERNMAQGAADACVEMFEAAGYDDFHINVSNNPPGIGIHELGTARMGQDPGESVFNSYNQAHDIANLFCTDGATFCSGATQNPSLTFMALTARAVNYAAGELKNLRL